MDQDVEWLITEISSSLTNGTLSYTRDRYYYNFHRHYYNNVLEMLNKSLLILDIVFHKKYGFISVSRFWGQYIF